MTCVRVWSIWVWSGEWSVWVWCWESSLWGVACGGIRAPISGSQVRSVWRNRVSVKSLGPPAPSLPFSQQSVETSSCPGLKSVVTPPYDNPTFGEISIWWRGGRIPALSQSRDSIREEITNSKVNTDHGQTESNRQAGHSPSPASVCCLGAKSSDGTLRE